MTAKRKRRPRSRRSLAPTPGARPVAGPGVRLARAAGIATALGVLAVGVAIAAQLRIVPLALPPQVTAALRVAGIGLVIAGFVLGRARSVAR